MKFSVMINKKLQRSKLCNNYFVDSISEHIVKFRMFRKSVFDIIN